ncbi:hypothetical protein NC653_007462 [Populus alba x Populus x berolinensis]|uniref:Uncharacterized protein n=1 Tax=Populus alba x Populus x berolinensis TaxID=444605 RepID=A0AAD6RGW4_9ROSI|nr:hypothetical protein NC653_007462 [Populus alba x Populus x berolinensis]
MGIVAKEDGVLKLVHPGRYVEIHRQPIAAAQVLESNPGIPLHDLMCLSIHGL